MTDKILAENECGCKAVNRTDLLFNQTRVIIEYCPKHAAALDMYEALREARNWLSFNHLNRPGTSGCLIATEIEKALQKAEGN